MDPCFSICVDAVESTVRIKMAGFFESTDICRFVDSMRTEYRKLSCGANRHRTLVDVRDMIIQSQASVDAFAALLADATYASQRIVFVVAAGLTHAQVRRAAAGRGALFCDTLEEAEARLRDRSSGVRSRPPAPPPRSADHAR